MLLMLLMVSFKGNVSLEGIKRCSTGMVTNKWIPASILENLCNPWKNWYDLCGENIRVFGWMLLFHYYGWIGAGGIWSFLYFLPLYSLKRGRGMGEGCARGWGGDGGRKSNHTIKCRHLPKPKIAVNTLVVPMSDLDSLVQFFASVSFSFSCLIWKVKHLAPFFFLFKT